MTMMISVTENYQGVWGNRVGFGNRPAVIVIDFVKAYTIEGSPLYAVGVMPAVRNSIDVLHAARTAGVRILHTTIRHHPNGFIDGGAWLRKSPVVKCLAQPPYDEFCAGVEPLASEIVIQKQYASAFFGTSLASTLTAAGIDTIILLGCSTSGCIRATAVDGVQHGFNVIVPRECVGDRHPDPHKANLFDIDSKYGDVVLKDDVLRYLRDAHPDRGAVAS
ncbi:isochorismatase family protein [Cupriavidus necator]|uniref:isochorismatase family protein n=1 Tax=Cupriavidus necator TaxID=106590 RepID=UPI0039C36B27